MNAKKFDFLALGVILHFRMHRLKALAKLSDRVLRFVMLLALVGPFALAYHLKTAPSWNECRSLISFGFLAAGLCFYLVVGLAALNRDLLRFGQRFDRFLLYFGSRSYGLYVFHFPLFMVPWLIIVHTAPWLAAHQLSFATVHTVLFLVTGLPFIEFSYRFVEQPAIRFGGRLAARFVATSTPVPENETTPVEHDRQAA